MEITWGGSILLTSCHLQYKSMVLCQMAHYLVHYFWEVLWSKVVHSVGNRVPFGTYTIIFMLFIILMRNKQEVSASPVQSINPSVTACCGSWTVLRQRGAEWWRPLNLNAPITQTAVVVLHSNGCHFAGSYLATREVTYGASCSIAVLIQQWIH